MSNANREEPRSGLDAVVSRICPTQQACLDAAAEAGSLVRWGKKFWTPAGSESDPRLLFFTETCQQLVNRGLLQPVGGGTSHIQGLELASR